MPSLIHALARQARKPSGLFGRLFGLSMSRINRQANTWVLALLDIRPDDAVLEIGFGPGQAIEALTSLVQTGSIAGIDFSPTMVAQARQRNRRAIEAGRVDLRAGEAARLPFPDNSFDKVFCVNVIYFWDDAARELADIARVLRPGGTVAIYMGDMADMAEVKMTRTGVFKLYSGEQLAAMLEQGGFVDTRVHAAAIAQGPVSNGVCVLGAKASKAAPPCT